MRLVLTVEKACASGLTAPGSRAMAWIVSMDDYFGLGPLYSADMEIVGEGVLAVETIQQQSMAGWDGFFATCPACEQIDDMIWVRRYYRGPVPPEVLAAFEVVE